MTKEQLEDYRGIVRRLERMESVCADTVMASAKEFPYTKHTVSIKGVPKQTQTDNVVLADLRRKRREIEEWMEALPTEQDKMLVELRVVDGLTWEQVAAKMGHQRSAAAAKVHYHRLLEKKLEKNM